MRLLEFFIEISVRSADALRGLDKVDGAAGNTKSALNRAGEAAASLSLKAAKMGSVLITAATPALLAFGREAIEASRSAEEAASKFSTVLGGQAAGAQKQADALAEAQGRSKYQTRSALGDLAALAKGYGLTETAAASLALQTQGLAVDLASFHDLSDAEVAGAFRSAYAGEFEPLARTGIKLSAAQIDNELKLMGATKDRATQAQRMLATYQAIAKAAERQKATGDAQRTKGSRANMVKTGGAKNYDASVEAGAKLAALDAKAQELKAKLADLFLGLGPDAQTAVVALGGVVVVLGNLGTALQAVVAWKLMSAGASTADTAATGANTGGIIANTIARMRNVYAMAAAKAAQLGMLASSAAMTAAVWFNTGGLAAATTAAWAFAAALWANPITWIVAAVIAFAGAAYLLWRNWDTVSAFFIAMWEAHKLAVRLAWDSIRAKFLEGVAYLESLPGRFMAIGQNVMTGLMNGIASGAQWVKNKILEIAGNIETWFKGALGINSPSRIFHGFGENLNQGLANGIMGSLPALRAAVDSMTAMASPSIAFAGIPTSAMVRAGGAAHAAGAGASRVDNSRTSYTISGADPQATARAVAARIRADKRGQAGR